jgi:GntR family transcriptional regulator/MocR family aminotransferase
MLERALRSMTVAQLNYGDTGRRAGAARSHRRPPARRARRQLRRGQVFITDGTQSSLDLCARAFADAGDTAWIENPGYGGALSRRARRRLKLVGHRCRRRRHRARPRDWLLRPPRLIYTTPSHQYPTGSVLSLRGGWR